jgi:hypothetical protein
MATLDLPMSVPSMGEAFQAYNANKTPCIQRKGDPVSAVLMRCTLLSLNVPAKSLSVSTMISRGRPTVVKNVLMVALAIVLAFMGHVIYHGEDFGGAMFISDILVTRCLEI